MKSSLYRWLAFVCGMVLTASLHAGSTTVLDGFEEMDPDMAAGTTTNGFTPDFCNFYAPDGSFRGFCNTNFSLFSGYGGRSGVGEVTNWVYTASGPHDPYVTEGTHSMAVTFFAEGFGNDIQIVLSDTNSFLVEQAAMSGQVGRYVLRYDVIFANPSQYVFFNQTAFVGSSWDYVQLSGANSNGLAVYSCALELPALGLPPTNSGTNIQILIADNFSTTQNPFTNCTIYFDNVRLVDTYASASTKPVIYPLQSFESGLSGVQNLYPTVTSFYGNPVTARAKLSVYSTNGLYDPTMNGVSNVYTMNPLNLSTGLPSSSDTDFAVTDGGHALMVSNAAPGAYAYQADFAISFAGTKLAQILSSNLPPSQLAHYTLRWDTTMPAVYSFFDTAYANMTYSTGLAALPIAQGRRESEQQEGFQRDTYSITLDQIAAWGGSPVGGDPAIIFFFDGDPMGSAPYIYFYDNFELIDTAPVIAAPIIKSFQYNPSTHQFTLTWSSSPDATYSVLSASALTSGSFTPLVTGIPSGGTMTTNTVTMTNGIAGFLKIQQN